MATPAFAHVQLDYPNGGETFCVNDTVTIQWHILIAHGQTGWDLDYSTTGAGGPWIPLATNLPPGATTVGSVHTYDWVAPDLTSSQMRIRVTMLNPGTDYNDTSNADFTLLGTGSATSTFRNDAGNTNPTGYSADPPVLGTTWNASVDNTGTGNTFAAVLGYGSSLEYFVPALGDYLLVNVADPGGELLALPATSGTGVVAFSEAIPDDPALCGFQLSTQGLGYGGGSITLHNAYDLVLGH